MKEPEEERAKENTALSSRRMRPKRERSWKERKNREWAELGPWERSMV